MFDIKVLRNRIDLTPLEIKAKGFTRKEYAKLEKISTAEKGQEKPITEKFIKNLKEEKD